MEFKLFFFFFLYNSVSLHCAKGKTMIQETGNQGKFSENTEYWNAGPWLIAALSSSCETGGCVLLFTLGWASASWEVRNETADRKWEVWECNWDKVCRRRRGGSKVFSGPVTRRVQFWSSQAASSTGPVCWDVCRQSAGISCRTKVQSLLSA